MRSIYGISTDIPVFIFLDIVLRLRDSAKHFERFPAEVVDRTLR